MPTPNQKRGAVALAAAALIATPFIGAREGLRHDPYRDTVGVLTVCYGETRVDMRHYTTAECQALLSKAITTDYGPKVLQCTPVLGDHPKALAAAISFAYNIGAAGYCGSEAARQFNAGNLVAGCNAFMRWHQPPEIIGRRRQERDLCLAGVR